MALAARVEGGGFPRMKGSDEHTTIRAYLDAHRCANNARLNRFCSFKSNNCGAHRILGSEYDLLENTDFHYAVRLSNLSLP